MIRPRKTRPAAKGNTLEHSHERDAIARRLSRPTKRSYLKDAVYGAIDGAVTTFAVVAGVSGAGLSPTIVIILGVANLVGDGFSMAAGNFLGTRAENQEFDRLKAVEKKHISVCPEGEREEIRQILAKQGYEGDLLEATLDHITADEEVWVETMLQHEYGLSSERPAAIPAALMTFFSFLVVGFIPLFPFVLETVSGVEFVQPQAVFGVSAVLTAVAFLCVGAIKSRYVDQHWLWSACETLAVGATAAALAYLCGLWLGSLGLPA